MTDQERITALERELARVKAENVLLRLVNIPRDAFAAAYRSLSEEEKKWLDSMLKEVGR